MSSASRSFTVSNRSGKSATPRNTPAQTFAAVPTAKDVNYFIPCAATSSRFLYAQGTSILCCHHDKLTIERKFSLHSEEVQLLAVDNVSDQGAGRLALSYDAGQTAIVWDLMTGDEMSRFVSYQHLTTAAWMRNGNVAFGNTQGNIILFEPSTCEHISSRTLDQIAVTALAPSSDCRTFAIGFSNGSLLVATLQPRFTVLHNLTTSKGPSPIVTLAWHASSSRSKADMLAVQTHDGDLRIWSITKSYNADDPAKVVRVLRRNETYQAGPNWMGWSKNGRIIQFSDSETLSWDVRTKHITRDLIPTLEHVKGIAVYGPGASLFTLGPNNTVQQFDLNAPSIMVANVQHPAGPLPPSPPTSEEIEARTALSTGVMHTSDHRSGSVQLGVIAEPRAESGNEAASPVSSRSGVSSNSRSSAGSRTPERQVGSMRSRGMTEATHISTGSSFKSSAMWKKDPDTYSLGYTFPSTSAPSIASSQSRHRPSRLRHEVTRSPDGGSSMSDLFKYTRSRLSDIPYKPPMSSNNSRLTNDDLRRQMLSTIFGWHREMEDLVRDELGRHPAGSANRILLSKWLGEMDADIMAAGKQGMTASDWMLLALHGFGGQGASQRKLGHAYVQRLLANNEVHVAVTMMLAMGDNNDAIEVYVSHKRYLEALILTCVTFPSVWERQAAIIRKWGEWAVQHGQQQLAIRCFACTGQESTEPWTSPSATQLTFQSMTTNIPEVLSPPLSPPGMSRGFQRAGGRSSALKLITSFEDQYQKAKFYSSQLDDGQTPIAAGVTPIAESALSPHGGQETGTAFLRPSNNSRFNTPTSARPSGPGFSRGRLSSIGEIPSDVNRGDIEASGQSTTSSVTRASHSRTASATQQDLTTMGKSLQRAATASPMMMRDRYQRVVPDLGSERPPSPDHTVMTKMQQAQAASRTVSRDRNTRGLHLQLQPLQSSKAQGTLSPDPPSSKYQWPSRHRGPGSVASSVTSASSTGRSVTQHDHRQRDREDYIHSLEAAQYYPKKTRSRQGSKERSQDTVGRRTSRERRAKSRDPSEERGRSSTRGWNKPKKSPTSPISMSPQDLAILSTRKYTETPEPLMRKVNSGKGKRTPSRASSRGRSKGRGASTVRSPSSPASLSAAGMHFQGSDDEEDYQRAVQAREEFRAKHSRSTSRGINSPGMTRRDASRESRRKDAVESSDAVTPLIHHMRAASASTSMEHAGDLRQMKDERQRKKEQAARELEERRKSLAKRQPVTIPHPSEISPAKLPVAIEADEEQLPDDVPPRSSTEPIRSMYARGPQHMFGLPATPRAMRQLPTEEDAAPVPSVPTLNAGSSSPPGGGEEAPLTLLPSTVYQPPSRAAIPRSMSAPIPEDGSGRNNARKGSTGEARGLGNIMEQERRQEDVRIPAPPAPPILKELQHLAIPPPPPPVPLPHMPRSMHNGGGALGSGMIEIVMDEEEEPSGATHEGMFEARPPSVASTTRGHGRHRSNGEGSISGASSRHRSHGEGSVSGASSRHRNMLRTQKLEIPADVAFNQLRSPTSGGPPPMMMYDPEMVYHSRNNSTGLSESEMF